MSGHHAAGTTSTVTETVRSELSGPVDIGRVLRGFNDLRERLASRLVGTEGLAIGYDVLDIDRRLSDQIRDAVRVTLSATLIGTRDGAHEVEYVAVLEGASDGLRPLVVARGWTQTPHRME